MHLFTGQIDNFDDWGKVFQSINAFAPLVQRIFLQENLPMAEIENLTPGTNAVFKVGGYVVKIFAPFNIGQDYGTNIDVELFGMRLANAQMVPAPMLIAVGEVQDKYLFKYMIMKHVSGKLFSEIEGGLSYEDKVAIGKNMREITARLNIPCANFTPTDVLQHAIYNNVEWAEEGFPPSLLEERLAYLAGVSINETDKVYCHGDLHVNNILVDETLNVYIVDFADAMYAPRAYEDVYIASGLFCFEKPYMEGYFGKYAVQDIVDLCMKWLPIHAWGHSIVEWNCNAEITSFAVMRERLYNLIAGAYKK